MPRFVPLALLILAPWLPSSLTAQAADAHFAEQLEVSEVLFDVVVTDKRGNLVTGLGREDFLIKIDGRQVEPAAVSFYSTRYAPAETTATDKAPAASEIPASRYFIFFFHDQRHGAEFGGRLVEQQLQAARRSREWVSNEMGPSDWIAVASYDVKLKVQQDFTQDRALLATAIDAAARGEEPERGRPTASYTEASLLRRLPSGRDLRDDTGSIYDGLRLLAEASGHIVGRKNLLLFSIGFGELGTNPIALPDRRRYPPLEEALNANNVAVYPIDLSPRDSEHLQSHFLSTLAHDTGGAYNQFFANFLTPLRQAAKDASGYYVLSYQDEHRAGDRGYREVEIRTRDKRLTARAQRGFRYGLEAADEAGGPG